MHLQNLIARGFVVVIVVVMFFQFFFFLTTQVLSECHL